MWSYGSTVMQKVKRLAKEHRCITHRQLYGDGKGWGSMGTSVIVSTKVRKNEVGD